MSKPAKIQTKWDGDYASLQVNGTTLQGVWRRRTYTGRGFIGASVFYDSDTFARRYTSIAEARAHTLDKAKQGYWGEAIQKAVTGD